MPFIPPGGKPDLAKIRTYLNNSQAKTKDVPLFQAVDILVQWLQLFGVDSISTKADSSITYITLNDERAKLPNSRQLVAGTGVTFDDTVPGQLIINV